MRGFIDLHSHWIATIDDGARSPAAAIAMLSGLYRIGFSMVVATPHMRPGMFENDRRALEAAYLAMKVHLDEATGVTLPEVGLASEHFFDDVVFRRLVAGQGLPYPGGRAVLIELPPAAFPAFLPARLFDLRRANLIPVLAHPERYQPVWKDVAKLEPILDAGTHLQLDLCSLVGKYGRATQRAAENLLEEEAYEIAASDAHKPEDIEAVAASIERLESLVGRDETHRLLIEGPRGLLGPAGQA